jgi:RNA polymerase sigma-70 factor (ECF subfamily)
MAEPRISATPDLSAATELELLARARNGNAAAFREIMQRNSRRLYRVVRSVLGDEAEAEDVVQDTYLKAFTHLAGFRGDARFSTWLTRVALNEALGRRRKERQTVDLEILDEPVGPGGAEIIPLFASEPASSPEQDAARHDIRRILEHAIDQLPEDFRIVFVMRAIEDMSVEETASALGLKPETIKSRLHRARRLLRNALEARLGAGLTHAFPFAGHRCLRIAEAVLERLARPRPE